MTSVDQPIFAQNYHTPYSFMYFIYRKCPGHLLMLLLFLLARGFVFAQTPTKDIRPMLKSLTKEEKLRLLEYLRHLGAGIDQEIQQTYELIAPASQLNVVRYIESVKASNKEQLVTTVRWDKDTLFFGSIPEGTLLIDSFALTNTGYEPYLIAGTKTTCDCTVLKAPEYPVMPGETAVFRVEFDSRGKRGTAVPAIIVYDNSAPNKRNILYLKGEITPRKQPRKNPWQD